MPSGHPIILPKFHEFNMAAVSVLKKVYLRRLLLLQFTTGMTIHNTITIHDRTNVKLLPSEMASIRSTSLLQ